VSAMGEARKFPREEIDTLDAIARQAAVIIENARFYEREQRQHQRREALTNVLTAASSTLDLREVLAKVCQAALQLTIGDDVSIFLMDESGESTPMMAAGRRGQDVLKKFLQAPPDVLKAPEAQRLGRLLMRRHKPFIISDAANTPFSNPWWAENFGVKSLAYYPLRAKGRNIGVMIVDAVEEHGAFPQEEIETLSAVARQVAVIIENARLYEQQQGQRMRAEALVGVLAAGASALSLKKVLVELCQTALDISVADRASIFMMTDDGSRLEPVMSLGADDPGLWEKFRNPRQDWEQAPESQQLFQAMTTMQEPVIAEDASLSPFLEKWWTETFGIKSIVYYPLRVKDTTIGMMTLDAFKKHVHFPKEELDTLAAIAKQAGVIIENARVYEREQAQRQRAEALVDVLTTAASSLELKKVLVKICQTATDISVGDRVSIFLMDAEGRLKPMMSLGVEDPELWERFRNSREIAQSNASSPDLRGFYGALTKLDQAVVIEDAPSSPLVPKWWCEAFQVKSLVHYPLRIKDKTIGLMTVDTFRQKVTFPAEELDTLAAIARQAAVVIESARLHEQLQEQA
ncbi:MAG: GAF domain-containing protein, partial [Chloroflexi bacterium]